MDAFEPTVVVEHEAVMGGFKYLYWLIKNELAHHTNYPKLFFVNNCFIKNTISHNKVKQCKCF